MTEHVEAIVDALANKGGRGIAITIAPEGGRSLTFKLTAATAAIMADAFQHFSKASVSGAEPTKLPKNFAVGIGRYEPIVLLRFEDEAPYGLSVDDAAELGEALVEQSMEISNRPALVIQ